MYFIMAKMSVVGTVLPALMLTLVNYFVYDLRDESYFLPFPVMYDYFAILYSLVVIAEPETVNSIQKKFLQKEFQFG